MPRSTAYEVLEAVGGSSNVEASDTCMTRLRLVLSDPSLIDETRLQKIPTVLGTLRRGDKSFEVVFGPAVINEVYTEFSSLTHNASQQIELTDRPQGQMRVVISPARQRSYRAQAEALSARSMASEGIASTSTQAALSPASATTKPITPKASAGKASLDDILSDIDAQEANNEAAKNAQTQNSLHISGKKLLLINGPNINMLGVREPSVYGTHDYPSLIELCKQAATEAGFVEMRYIQSNYEGAIVDEIQQAYGVYDGIVINPAAYTHTSIAILDALKAVQIPAVEVHISDINDRESFRQNSYIRSYCISCISGQGIQGYRTAIFELASYLASYDKK